MADYKGFRDVDSIGETEFFFEFLDAASASESVQRYRARMAEVSAVGPGDRVLDVGCGLGHEAVRLARLVGAEGRVVGVDSATALIEEARRRTASSSLPLEFQVGDVNALGYDDAAFDLVRAERVLLYLENPRTAVREMARVARPGGRIAVFDFDYRAFFLDSDLPALNRRIETILMDDVPNPLIARDLPVLLRGAGLDVTVIEPHAITPTFEMAQRIYSGALETAIAAGRLAVEERDLWWRDQQRMDQRGRSYAAHTGYIVVATKG